MAFGNADNGYPPMAVSGQRTQLANGGKKPPSLADLNGTQKGRLALNASLNGASLIEAYPGNVLGKDADIAGTIESLRANVTEVKSGDLYTLEAMLISQATALQTNFMSLVRRAQALKYQKNLEACFGAGLEGTGAEPGNHRGAGGLEVPTASHVREAGQKCPRAAKGEQRRIWT